MASLKKYKSGMIVKVDEPIACPGCGSELEWEFEDGWKEQATWALVCYKCNKRFEAYSVNVELQ